MVLSGDDAAGILASMVLCLDAHAMFPVPAFQQRNGASRRDASEPPLAPKAVRWRDRADGAGDALSTTVTFSESCPAGLLRSDTGELPSPRGPLIDVVASASPETLAPLQAILAFFGGSAGGIRTSVKITRRRHAAHGAPEDTTTDVPGVSATKLDLSLIDHSPLAAAAFQLLAALHEGESATVMVQGSPAIMIVPHKPADMGVKQPKTTARAGHRGPTTVIDSISTSTKADRAAPTGASAGTGAGQAVKATSENLRELLGLEPKVLLRPAGSGCSRNAFSPTTSGLTPPALL